MPPKPSQKTPEVIELYKGVKIRKCNRVTLLFGVVAYKKIIDHVEETGLSIPKLLALSGKPCEKCKDVCVIVYNNNGDAIKVKRGILTASDQPSGQNIIQKNNQLKDAKISRPSQKNQ